MTAIGFRCWKDRFAFICVDGTQSAPTLIESGLLRAPAEASRPEQLAWLRQEVQALLGRLKPSRGAFKKAEPSSRTKDMERGQFEGVLMEACFKNPQGLLVDGKVKRSIAAAMPGKPTLSDLDDAIDIAPFNSLSADKFREASFAAYACLPPK